MPNDTPNGTFDLHHALLAVGADEELLRVLAHLDSALRVIDAVPMSPATNAMHAAITVLRAQLAAGEHRRSE